LELNDKLFKMFLTEMQALESFRQSYSTEHAGAALGREDPDVRRLMEAMALFSARARLASQASIGAMRQRVIRQLVPYLTSPLAALAIVDASPNAKLSEAVVLPRGTAFELRSGDSPAGFYQAISDVRVLPVQLVRAEIVPRPSTGYRISLVFEANHPRLDEIGTLSLYVDYLDDFFASFGVVAALREHIKKAQVVLDEPVGPDTEGTACTVGFGLDPAAVTELWPHPVLRERYFFHFPWLENFVSISVPPLRKQWRRFTISLDVGPNWPRSIRLSPHVLRPFAVATINTARGMSQPVTYDGTSERVAVRHPKAQFRFDVQGIRGVYRVRDGAMEPLRPGVLAGGNGSYEVVEEPGADGRAVTSVLVRFPQAFEKAFTIAVDADWYQPGFSGALGENLKARPYSRVLQGVDWEVIGRPVAHRDVDAAGQLDNLLAVVVLQRKQKLDFEDLRALLSALGSVWSGPFLGLRDILAGLNVREVPTPQAGGGTGIRLVYELQVKEHDASLDPLLRSFARHLGAVLEAWVADLDVEVRLVGVQ
jgi:type VI secretion system protein ImpG